MDENREIEMARHLVSTKISLGNFHLLNNGMVCETGLSEEVSSCGPCMYNGQAGCIKKSSIDLGVEIISEYYNCYAVIRRDRVRITKLFHKSLFMTSKLKRAWQNTLRSEE